MLYKHHGVNYGFTGHYDEYYSGDTVDGDALVYLQLANRLLAESSSITIAEDVSGTPLLCRSTEAEAGVGFTYRLAMGIPDMWIRLVKGDISDEDWNIGSLLHTLTNRRQGEPVIAYAESHDQALVGDKTLAFWMMDSAMYDHMSLIFSQNIANPIIDRGIALHKMIRLATFALGGESYLTFMGNEFGHPEWLDFPREGNNWSYWYARRQYNLARDPSLLYSCLAAFEKAMLRLDCDMEILAATLKITWVDEDAKIFVCERKSTSHILIFAFNWHPYRSQSDYRIPTSQQGLLQLILCTDDFGGHGRVKRDGYYFTDSNETGKMHSFRVYLPTRSALVLKMIE